MSVRQRAFTVFQGTATPVFHRPLVIARYTLAGVFRSRLFTMFFVACYLPAVVFLVTMYLRYNLDQIIPDSATVVPGPWQAAFDDWLYYGIMKPLLWLSYMMILVVGPGLVAPDVKDNALPLYLSRPLTKVHYVLGKLLVLFVLTAAVTWLPGLLLVLINASYAADGWLLDNLSVPLGLVATSLVWTLCLSMIALAISAWVRWRPAATLGFLGLVVIGSSIGNLMRGVRDDWLGSLIILFDAIDVVARDLFGASPSGLMPHAAAWGVLIGATAISTWALLARIRAYEVVR